MTKNKVIVDISKRNKLETALFFEDVELSISSSSKILGISAFCRIINYEVLNGELKVAGKISSKILYLCEDGEISCFEHSKEFLETIVCEKIASQDKAFLNASIADIVFSGERDLKIKFTLSIDGYFIKEMPIEYIDCQGEDILCKKTLIDLERIDILTDTNIETSQSFESKRPIAKILSYNTVCHINGVSPSEGMYQVDGDACSTIIGVNEENQLLYQSFTQSFSVEVPDANITQASCLLLECVCKSTTIILEEELSQNLMIDLALCIKGINIMNKQMEIVADAYSLSKELVMQEASLSYDANLWQKTKSENLKETINSDIPLSSVEAVITPVCSTIGMVSNFGCFAEGIIDCRIICKNSQDELITIAGELPYQILVDKDYNGSADATIQINNFVAKLKNANEVELSIDVCIMAKGCESKVINIITDIEEGEAKETNEIAISLYISGEGESLWDVAKTLSTDEDTLLNLNPDIKLPLQSGEKLLLYRELNL